MPLKLMIDYNTVIEYCLNRDKLSPLYTNVLIPFLETLPYKDVNFKASVKGELNF